MDLETLVSSLEYLYDVKSIHRASRVSFLWNKAARISLPWRLLLANCYSRPLQKSLSLNAYSTLSFDYACLQGNLQLAKWIKNDIRHPPLVRFARPSVINLFHCLCENGQLEVAKWFADEFDVRFEDLDFPHHPLKLASRNGHFDTTKWLKRTFRVSREDVMASIHSACWYGHLEIAKWLQMKFSITKEDMGPGFCYHAPYGPCQNGHLEALKWMVETFHITGMCDEGALIGACENGHLKIVRWLHERFDISAHRVYYCNKWIVARCFSAACSKGHLELAKWLHETFNLSAVDVRACPNFPCNQDALQLALANRHVEVAEWLQETFDLIISRIDGQNKFRSAKCHDNHGVGKG